MHKIQVLNQISAKGLERFQRETYEVASEIGHPDAILLRSHKLSPDEIPPSIKAIARAGAGVNNVPIEYCTEKGLPVFNTPGANANSVKELVLAALLLGSRGITAGIEYVASLSEMQDKDEMSKLLEKEKKRFRGQELNGKSLGIVGLGAIGSMVADAALSLGMKVFGYDPALSVESAWRLSSEVTRMDNLQSLLSKSDYITLHIPVFDSTRNLINQESLKSVKPGAKLLNFARQEIVDESAVIAALDDKALSAYICDFPTPSLIGRDDVILMPHIGASTNEAEENCAIMAADQLKDFLENGNTKNSVNFPNLYLERTQGFRIGVANQNVPKMLGQVLSILADGNINVIDMLNKSRESIAYNLIDVESKPSAEILQAIQDIEGVINVSLF
ncbi:MAG: 3-phosphoglycerate dehydrogenase [Gammaproteobacteria bacterium]|nr:MAG: 3-phosphoglycerate dehydrogenase [Gammaproteobacteria bacterium]